MNSSLLVPLLTCSILLTGCLEGLGEDDVEGDISSGSSGNDCNLKELITDADRSAANACGVQASSQLANADVYYSAAVSACRSGETGTNPDTGATTTYKDTYKVYEQAADYALQVVAGLNCGAGSSGGSGGFEVPADAPDQYNLCVGYIENGTRALASCYGPVRSNDSSCGDARINYLKSYTSQSGCINERDTWLNEAFND